MVMRGAKRKGVRYFGPYAHAYAIRETLDLLLRTFPIRTCTKGKFDRHQRLGRPCLYAHIEKCAAPCVGAVTPRGVRRARRRAARSSSTATRRRSSTGSTSRCTRRATRSSSSAPRACATRSSRCARRSSASRWSTPRRRTTTSSGSSRTRSRRRCRCSSCARAASSAARAWWSTRSRTSTTPELVGRLLEQLYGDADRRRHPTRGPRARRCPTTPSSTRSSSACSAARKVRRPGAAARREARAARRRSRRTREEAFARHKLRARVRPQRAGPRARRAAGGARPARGAAAHRVLRHLEPPGHRDRRVDGGDGGRLAEALRLPALQDAATRRARTTSRRWKRC